MADSSTTSATPAGSVGADRVLRGRCGSRCGGRCGAAGSPTGRRARRGSRRTARGRRGAVLPDAVLTASAPSAHRVAGGVGVRPGGERRGLVEDLLGAGDDLGAARPGCSRGRARRRPSRGWRRCRRARRTGCPSARWRRSARSGRWRPARRAAGRRCWRSRGRRSRCGPGRRPAPAAGSRCRGGSPGSRPGSNVLPLWSRCQRSICCCSSSRRASRAALRGARSRIRAGETGPKRFGADASAWQRLADEVVQLTRDLQPRSFDPIHVSSVRCASFAPLGAAVCGCGRECARKG